MGPPQYHSSRDGTLETAGGYYRAVLNLSRLELSRYRISVGVNQLLCSFRWASLHGLAVLHSSTSRFLMAYDHNNSLSSL